MVFNNIFVSKKINKNAAKAAFLLQKNCQITGFLLDSIE